jgi:aspartate dehydrogenase
MSKLKKLKIGIVGCGAIGSKLGVYIDKNLKSKVRLVAVSDRNQDRIRILKKKLKFKPASLKINELIEKVDLVIETASWKCAKDILAQSLSLNKDVIILSVGVLIRYPGFLKKINQGKAKVYIPSGAICGIDGLGALSLGPIKRLTLTTSKPPASLKGIDYLAKKGIKLRGLKKEKVVFKGGIKSAIKYFPQNINVAATLCLVSGRKDIQVIIKANPKLKRNIHSWEATGDASNIKVELENFPSPDNPKTSYLTVLAVENLLRKITSNLKIGS